MILLTTSSCLSKLPLLH